MTQAGKVAVVTGAGQGLGRALAIALSEAGFKVALLGRTLAKLEATAALCPGECLPLSCDLIDPDRVREAFARIVARFGRVDVLVNNAASYAAFPLDGATDSQIIDVVHQSLVAPMFCAREAIARMRATGGDIVNISTQSVISPQPLMIVYAAAKGGLEIFSRGLRNELRGENIRVLTVQLGVVAGTVVDDLAEDVRERYGQALRNAGLDRAFVFPGSEPADIAASVVHAVTAPRTTIIEDIVIRGLDQGPA
ncbi:SDR family oxidoreductase [Novosphingobium bradum]|uniref:SDR family oxidoreductase n=1 Tax=Novosphingobium bradum TaxID=1737444 RepID=A0ABV7INY7_9SPHN